VGMLRVRPKGEGFSGRGQRAPPPARESGECCKPPAGPGPLKMLNFVHFGS